MYVEGSSQRSIGRLLKVSPQTVANWIKAYTSKLPPAPMPEKPRTAELEELYSFVEQKNEIYILTVVDRDTHCVLSWDVVLTRSAEALQACLERAPQAKQYHSDALPVYDTLYYGAPYEMRTDKQETYSVEAVNADLRHYLKRLARKSRCFSRRLEALYRNIRLFVYCYNQRQLTKRLYPKCSFHLIDFLCPLS
jgi:insertion element IS1 protein InsB